MTFEPIGEEIDCDEEETILDAAFREGYSLVYGCREGQCSACKCYLLEGEVVLKPYSSFALSESEETQGYTLLCRAMPEEDLVVELLHFDPDNYKLDVPIRDGRARVSDVEELTHDISRVELEVLDPIDFSFLPGQYVDIHLPDCDDRRSFSLANLPGNGRLELFVKRYAGGRFAGLLEDGLEVGTEFGFTGPYGAFHLRDAEAPILMVAGGSGMAPELGVLRELARTRSSRQVRFFYGARRRADLFHLDVIEELGNEIANFTFVPVLSEAQGDDDWNGAVGYVHEEASRFLDAGGFGEEPHAYLCGPPPMVDATLEALVERHGLEERDIHYDKFISSAAGDGTGQEETAP
ncbi:MAG: 2Fe-2S iron-sulfur cluster binding domain-containing protein [Solirubrobacteraceae bacterium]|nr:2Fe-2S iron-sulfur cluster binding domain-containing protein [Solirubrobacteraceae bacterium]